MLFHHDISLSAFNDHLIRDLFFFHLIFFFLSLSLYHSPQKTIANHWNWSQNAPTQFVVRLDFCN